MASAGGVIVGHSDRSIPGQLEAKGRPAVRGLHLLAQATAVGP